MCNLIKYADTIWNVNNKMRNVYGYRCHKSHGTFQKQICSFWMRFQYDFRKWRRAGKNNINNLNGKTSGAKDNTRIVLEDAEEC